MATGFETETELSVHAAALNMPVAEVETPYFARPAGTESKLNTWRDGFRILGAAFKLAKDERPLFIFGLIGLSLVLLSLGLALPVILTFAATGLVPRLPTAVLAAAIMGLASLSFVAGIILDGVSNGRREIKRLHYLAHGPVREN